MKKIEIPDFDTKKELFKFLIANKAVLIAQKCAETKHADGIIAMPQTIWSKEQIEKGIAKANEAIDPTSLNDLKVKVIINTTNLLDSHGDVHLPGLWDKSLKENKMIMHLQEHESRKFSYIIADGEDLKAYIKDYSWSELGFNEYKGKTQGLTFESNIKRARNPYMLEQYARGYVKNHSVGMRYVKLLLAVDDEEYGAEFEAWEKYIDQVANREAAEAKGYFWVVKEAKVVEGSAVPMGSNFATPTLDNNMKNEPLKDTRNNLQPEKSTEIDYNYLIERI